MSHIKNFSTSDYSSSSPNKISLRSWQRDAFLTYQQSLLAKNRTLLWEATPGSGKTTAALRVALEELCSKRSERILVVVPTAHLKTQWAQSAAKFGIHLDSSFGSTRQRLSADFCGAIVTYQQIGNRLKLFGDFASRATVILDEVHHAADGLTWSNALISAFSNAPCILSLSGTAFRSDSNPIPFVRYNQEGLSLPDYTYSYARAVEEGVCRPTAFFTFAGEVSWSEQDKIYTARYEDALDSVGSARRLRASLDPAAGWIQPMIKEAHQMLMSIRREHASAVALLVCADQKHARQLAIVLQSISGLKPTLVLSDDAKASKKIKEFSEGTMPWLIACNMVSEGVDIPRLRVGVYATTIRTKMYFRQFLGRVVRRQVNVPGHQVAYLYLPADPYLRHFAEEIESETRHVVRPAQEWFGDDDGRQRKSKDSSLEKSWTPLSSINSGIDAVIVHGNQLSFFTGSLPTEEVQQVVQREIALRLEAPLTKSEKKQALATEIKRMVGAIHNRSGKAHSAIHMALNRKQRVHSQIQCTEEQLQQRVKLLEEMLYRG